MALRPEPLDEKTAAVVVNLRLAEGLLPGGLAVGAAPALDDIEMPSGLAFEFEELCAELFFDPRLMSLAS